MTQEPEFSYPSSDKLASTIFEPPSALPSPPTRRKPLFHVAIHQLYKQHKLPQTLQLFDMQFIQGRKAKKEEVFHQDFKLHFDVTAIVIRPMNGSTIQPSVCPCFS